MILPRHSAGTECDWDDSFRISISDKVKCQIKNAENKSGIKATKEQIENAQLFLDKNDGSVMGICNKDTIFKGTLILNTGSAGGYVIVAKDGCLFKGIDEYVEAISGEVKVLDMDELYYPAPFRISEQLKYEIGKAEKKSGLKATYEQIETAQRFLEENGGIVHGIANKDNVFKGALVLDSERTGVFVLISKDGRMFFGLDEYAAAMNQE